MGVGEIGMLKGLVLDESEVETYRREVSFKNGVSFSKVPWLTIKASDAQPIEKMAFALTLGRASFGGLALMDAGEFAKASGLGQAEVAPGHYLMGPDGKLACAYITEVEGGASHWDMFESVTLAALKEKGLATHATFVTRNRVDLPTLLSRDNQFADAMNADFGKGSYESHGVEVTTRRLDELAMAGGYAAAWRIGNAKIGASMAGGAISSAESFEITLGFDQLASCPFNNHAAKSLVKNIRDFCHVNNTDDGSGANQPAARDEIVEGMIDDWIAKREAMAGLLDAKAGLDASVMSEGRLVAERAAMAATHDNPKGNEKKLATKPSETVWIAQPGDGLREVMVVSRDMAFIDGQHSSRNYALIAEALSRTGGKAQAVHYEGESVVNCSLDHFKKLFEKKRKAAEKAYASSLKAKGLDPKKEPSWADKVGLKPVELNAGMGGENAHADVWANDKDDGFKQFVFHGLAARACVKTVPVSTPEQALALTKVANTARPISISAMAEHAGKSFLASISEAFNAVAQRVGDPTRLVGSKGACADPSFATNLTLAKHIQDVFGCILAATRRVHHAADKIEKKHVDHARALMRAIGGEKPSQAEVLKCAALLQMSGKIKSRDFVLSSASVRKGEAEHMGREDELASSDPNESNFGAFANLTTMMAFELVFDAKIGKSSDLKAYSQQDRTYAVVKSAMAFQDELDAQWARISGQGGKGDDGKEIKDIDKERLPRFFNKATFVNWMILGTLQARGEIASQEARDGIGMGVDNLLMLKKAGMLTSGMTHNAARQSFVACVDAAKAQSGPNNPLKSLAAANQLHLQVLVAAFPGEGSTLDWKAIAKGNPDVGGGEPPSPDVKGKIQGKRGRNAAPPAESQAVSP